MSLSNQIAFSKCKSLLNIVRCTTLFRENNVRNRYPHRPKLSCVKISLSLLSTMSMNKLSEIKPPTRVKGMMKWDKTAFNDTITVQCVLCTTEKLNSMRKLLTSYMIRQKRLTPIVDLDSSDERFKTHRLILFDPAKVSDFQSLPEQLVEKLKLIGFQESDFQTTEVKIGFENWSFADIIRAIVPDEVEDSTTGYSEIGHIAHFNLREEMLPYKHVLGEAMLDSSKKIKTVVNKTNVIDNTYRTFELELLAGENNYVTEVVENNCKFELDFSKVYWNSRLSTEHCRVIEETHHGDLVFDVFAGIGPFAVPCAKKGSSVFANDLNPVSHEYLQKNRKKNKVDEDRLKVFCQDGREFIQTVVKEELIRLYTEGSIWVDYKVHVVMNLPAIAVTFLDAFQGLLSVEKLTIDPKHDPIVYCYCFTDIKEADESWDGDMDREIKERVRKYLPVLSIDDISLRYVRDVAPQKYMKCISFVLRNNILFGSVDQEDKTTDEPPSKCRKTEG